VRLCRRAPSAHPNCPWIDGGHASPLDLSVTAFRANARGTSEIGNNRLSVDRLDSLIPGQPSRRPPVSTNPPGSPRTVRGACTRPQEQPIARSTKARVKADGYGPPQGAAAVVTDLVLLVTRSATGMG
jgi:hypothetical protein